MRFLFTTSSTCLLAVLLSACASPTPDQLPISTPPFTTEIATANETPASTQAPASSPDQENLEKLQLLHEYWLVVATAAGVDPYEMDLSAVASDPRGRYLAVGGCSKPLEADLRSGNIYCTAEDTENSPATPFLLILDANTEDTIGRIPEHEANTTIADMSFTPDGEKLIYAVHPGKFAIWDIASARLEAILWEGETSAPRLALSPDGRWIALKTADHVVIWDTSGEEFVAELPAYYRPQFSSTGDRMLVYREQEFIIYETGTWTEQMRFGIPCDCVYAFSPDFSLLATSERPPAENAPILIWDVLTGEQIQIIEGSPGFTMFLEFTPAGDMLWRARERGDLTAWSTTDWRLLAEQIGGITPISSLQGFQFVEGGQRYLLYSDLHLGLYGLP